MHCILTFLIDMVDLLAHKLYVRYTFYSMWVLLEQGCVYVRQEFCMKWS